MSNICRYENCTSRFIKGFNETIIDNDCWLSRIYKIKDPVKEVKLERRAAAELWKNVQGKLEKIIKIVSFTMDLNTYNYIHIDCPQNRTAISNQE